jgi:hypothetical protein
MAKQEQTRRLVEWGNRCGVMAALSIRESWPNDRYDSSGPGVLLLFSVMNGPGRTSHKTNLQNRLTNSFALGCAEKDIGLAKEFGLVKMCGIGKLPN